MNEQIKIKIEKALNEPSVPEELVTRTIRRCQLVTAGRKAEETLETKGDAVTDEERRTLAADSILGRLASQNDVPEALNTQRLIRDDRFCRLADRPAGKFLSDVRQGRIFREITEAVNQSAVGNQKTAENQKTVQKQPDPPVKKAPVKTGPMM